MSDTALPAIAAPGTDDLGRDILARVICGAQALD